MSLSLKLEGALSSHADPDISVRGGKGVNTDCLLCPRHREGNFTSLPVDRTDSSLGLNYFPPAPSPPYLYGLFPWLLQGFIQMSPSQWGLDHLIKNRSLESEVTPQGQTVHGWVCLAPCTSYSTLTSSVGVSFMIQVVKVHVLHRPDKKSKYQKVKWLTQRHTGNNLIELGCIDLLFLAFCKTLLLYTFLSECMFFSSLITILQSHPPTVLECSISLTFLYPFLCVFISHLHKRHDLHILGDGPYSVSYSSTLSPSFTIVFTI